MEINTLQNPSASNFVSPIAEAPAKATISSDFETFLIMLTTQMQNQDPLNPIDSSDFAVQLATFSSVEQQVKTNDLLTSLGQQFGLMSLSQLAGWVGMEARVAAPAYFDGSPITVYPSVATTADNAILTATDENGLEVMRQQIGLTGSAVPWAGVGTDGQPLPAGLYHFNVENYSNSNLIATDPAQIYSLVTEAKSENGATIVVLAGGAEVPSDDIKALRAPAL